MTDINENAIVFIEITLGESIVVKITTKCLSECNISQYNENFYKNCLCQYKSRSKSLDTSFIIARYERWGKKI